MMYQKIVDLSVAYDTAMAIEAQSYGTLANMSNRPVLARLARWSPAIIGVVAFALYLLTAAPSIAELFDDSLEFQLVGPTFGIAHPTGYPLYTILGGLWSNLLPIGNWAWRMNVLSALFGALAVALLFSLTGRLVVWRDGSANRWAALAAALVFGLGPVWWSQTTIAEVYALHICLVTAILWVTVGMNRTLDAPSPDRRALNRRMTWLALLIGLGLAHHRTTALLLPGIALYLLWSVPDLWRPRWVWLRWLAALLAPLLLYAYLPLRAAMGVMDLNNSYVYTWVGFWRHVMASSYTSFFSENALAVQRSAADWLQLFEDEMGVLGLVLALLGLPWLVDRHRRPVKAWIFILIVLLTNLLFALFYRVGDVEVFLLPVFLCAAIFAGGGIGLFGRLLEDHKPWVYIVQALFVLALAFSALSNGLPVNRSNDWAIHDYTVAMAKFGFPPGSHVIGLEGEMTALKYMQQAEGLGLAATPVVADDPNARRQLVEELVASGTPVYLTRELPGIENVYSFTGDGPLIRVWPRGESEVATPSQRIDLAMLNGALTIDGFDLILLEEAGGPALRITYYWLPHKALAGNYKLSMRVQGADGAPLTRSDGLPIVADAFPLRQAALTSHWLPGERLADVHYLSLPAGVSDQAATLETIIYDAESVEEIGRFSVDLKAVLGL